MALFSKLHPDTKGVSCQQLTHPFTSSCTLAALDMLGACTAGSAKFFAIIYLLQFLLRACQDRKKARDFLSMYTLKGYLRSVTYGSVTGTTFTITNCFTRWILGRYYDYSACLLPAFVGGAAIVLDTPARRRLVITSYANMALDSLLRRLHETGDLQFSDNGLTLAFMVTNAALMYMLKFGGTQLQSFWFFTPQKESESTEESNKLIQTEKLRTLFLRYFLTGLAVSAARLVFSDLTLVKNPFRFLSRLLSGHNLALGAFLASYVTIHQLTEHILSSKQFGLSGRESTIAAALLAGTTFRLQASRTIFSSAVVNVFQLTLQILQNNGTLPRLPYEEFLFCCYNGFLYHMRCMNPTAVPRTFIRIMSLATSQRSDYIYSYYAKILGIG